MDRRENTEQNRGYKPPMPKWVKILLIIVSALLLLAATGWLVLSWYINTHKKQLLADITAKIGQQISGNLQIRDMEPALLKSFPDISVRLESVVLQDSLYSVYKCNTIDLRSVYVKLNLFSLLSAHPKIKKVTLADGSIHLFTQQNGYSNIYLFERKKTDGERKKPKAAIHRFGIENVTFIYDHIPHNKEFKVTLRDINGLISNDGNLRHIHAKTDAHIAQLGFNLAKGAYFKNADLKGSLHIIFHTDDKSLALPAQTIQVNGIRLTLKALFNFGVRPAAFDLDLDAPSLNFTKAAGLLSQNISAKLNKITISKDIAVHALIKGSFQYPDTPFVHVYVKVKNNTVATPYGVFEHASFNPEFDNHVVPGKGRGDDNSGILVNHFTGEWFGIPVTADSTLIYGLRHPLLTANLHSDFPIDRMNDIIGSSYTMNEGRAAFRVTYRGPVTPQDTFARSLDGFFVIKNAGITYLPRALKFQRCNATLLFKGEDMYLKNMTLSSQKSTITINGIAHKFLNAYFTDPSKAVFNCQVSSDLLDLNEFKSFLIPRKSYAFSTRERNRKIRNFNHQLDLLLAKSTMLLDVHVQKIVYRKFRASDIKAGVTLQENNINLDNVRLAHAGGALLLNGSIRQQEAGNPFRIKAKINNVKVDQLFDAFENFGQDALTAGNIKGTLSADISLSGGLQETGALIRNSLDGRVHFTLANGELNNFPPFLSISRFIFKKRNLDHITFKTLSNDLDIRDGKVTIHPMKILSSAIEMDIEGVYALNKGTDISMKIPLRNPEKDKKRLEQGLKPKKNKGIIIYLRARDDANGKVHIGWDPMQKTHSDDAADLFLEDGQDTTAEMP